MSEPVNQAAHEPDAPPPARTLWAPRAWVDGAWQTEVRLDVDARGCWQAVTPGQPCPPGAERLPGAVLPPLVDAHSHAFQRAFAGLAERREAAQDDFWRWRERMYAVALRIGPAQLRAVAAHLYAELLAGGYTQVCEFHYLHHDPDGHPYADRAELALALAAAAQDAGIGLTLLPALYRRAGFGAAGLLAEQRRFALDSDAALTLQRRFAAAPALRGTGAALLDAGVAVHSLRAAAPLDIGLLAEGAARGPLHIHVAEQAAEVAQCQRELGARPIEWLARQGLLDARWQLVHATHTTPAEVAAVATSGAGVVLCPGTEANLGDGLPDLPRWLDHGVPLSIGSDSQVTRAWPEELRWLEYGQRLVQQRRNVAADPQQAHGATAARLFEAALRGSAAAAGFRAWGLVRGARADLLVLDPAEPALAGVPAAQRLDALVFAAPAQPFAQTWVAGRRVQPDRARLAAAHAQAMHALWGG